MEIKKNPKFDIERKRNHFFLIGLVFATSCTLLAFEWRTTKNESLQLSTDFEESRYEEDMIQTVRKKEVKVPKPKFPKNKAAQIDPTINDQFKVVPNQVDVTKGYEPIDLNSWDDWMHEGDLIEIDTIVDFAEFAPEYPGGDAAMLNFIAKRVKYTPRAKDAGAEGYVGVSFVVEKDGSISNINLDRPLHRDLDKMVIKAVEEMPHWKPGVSQGQHVRTRFRLPVKFQLD